MRKILKRIVLLLLCCFILGGCEKRTKPDDISEEMYKNAVYAIKLVDSYLEGKSSFEETMEKLYKIDVEYDYDYYLTLKMNDKGEIIDENLEFQRDPMINIEIIDIRGQMLYMEFANDEQKENTLEKIKELRDKLAERINYKK